MINYFYRKYQFRQKKKAIKKLMVDTAFAAVKIMAESTGFDKEFKLYCLPELYKAQLMLIKMQPLKKWRQKRFHPGGITVKPNVKIEVIDA